MKEPNGTSRDKWSLVAIKKDRPPQKGREGEESSGITTESSQSPSRSLQIATGLMGVDFSLLFHLEESQNSLGTVVLLPQFGPDQYAIPPAISNWQIAFSRPAPTHPSTRFVLNNKGISLSPDCCFFEALGGNRHKPRKVVRHLLYPVKGIWDVYYDQREACVVAGQSLDPS